MTTRQNIAVGLSKRVQGAPQSMIQALICEHIIFCRLPSPLVCRLLRLVEPPGAEIDGLAAAAIGRENTLYEKSVAWTRYNLPRYFVGPGQWGLRSTGELPRRPGHPWPHRDNSAQLARRDRHSQAGEQI